jgi:transcriptional regulator with PAS, ATPase and Fis domain
MSSGHSDEAQGAAAPVREISPEQLRRSAILATFVAADPKSVALRAQAEKIAASSATLLIRGESGTGKDKLASLIHYLGPRGDEPLLTIDCASLPHELMESELFGYERGAFTGAVAMKRGRLEMAGAGTIVLDEIAALSMPMQAKLLRVIEEKRFERLGGVRPVVLAEDVRMIAITNIDLEHALARHAFREDLYYRLNVVPLLVPPLRQRPGDIAPLAQHLLSQLCQVHVRPQKTLAPAALKSLEQYGFPGNVRELRNLLERAVISAAGPEIPLDDLPAYVVNSSAAAKKPTLEEMERVYIAEILDYTRGRKSRAAEILGISRKTLLDKRKRYHLDE